jgi:hypothetical protein
MPKEFYTEKDIEDLVKRGIFSLEVNDNVILTDLAYEKANKLGMRLVRDRPDNPPSAPVRPYITQNRPGPTLQVQPTSQPAAQPLAYHSPATLAAPPTVAGAFPTQTGGVELHQRIHDAVVARLGSQVDAKLLDVIITRVLQSTGVK